MGVDQRRADPLADEIDETMGEKLRFSLPGDADDVLMRGDRRRVEVERTLPVPVPIVPDVESMFVRHRLIGAPRSRVSACDQTD